VRAMKDPSVLFEVYVHATESQEKVAEAVKKCVPSDLLGRLRWSLHRAEGYFGNPILIMRLEASGEDLPERLVGHVARELKPSDKERVSRNFDRYVDEKGILSLRLDKQRAYIGELALSSSDAICIRVRAKPRGRATALEAVKSIARKAGLVS